jgi:hypothetical protein
MWTWKSSSVTIIKVILRSGNKEDILEYLNIPHSRSTEAKAAAVVVQDMAAIVHIIRPTTANTYLEYVSMHLVPY